jgi:hypothetical protein
MADSEKPRVRTLETPMMPDNVRVSAVPPSHVGIAAPEARNYVHPAPSPSESEESSGSKVGFVLIGMAVMFVIMAGLLAALSATGHLTIR